MSIENDSKILKNKILELKKEFEIQYPNACLLLLHDANSINWNIIVAYQTQDVTR